jgi:hypothetical protein
MYGSIDSVVRLLFLGALVQCGQGLLCDGLSDRIAVFVLRTDLRARPFSKLAREPYFHRDVCRYPHASPLRRLGLTVFSLPICFSGAAYHPLPASPKRDGPDGSDGTAPSPSPAARGRALASASRIRSYARDLTLASPCPPLASSAAASLRISLISLALVLMPLEATWAPEGSPDHMKMRGAREQITDLHGSGELRAFPSSECGYLGNDKSVKNSFCSNPRPPAPHPLNTPGRKLCQ